MLRTFRTVLVVLAVAGLLASAAAAADKIRVVATIPDLKALTEEVGGKLVDVEALARGTQNAHELEIRPSLMLKLRRADLLIENGLELDSWADVAVQGANNPNIVRGASGRIDVSRRRVSSAVDLHPHPLRAESGGDARGSSGHPGVARAYDAGHSPDERRADQGAHRRALERLEAGDARGGRGRRQGRRAGLHGRGREGRRLVHRRHRPQRERPRHGDEVMRPGRSTTM